MKRYVKSAHYTTYQGHQIRVNEGETTPQAITRYRNQLAKEEADRLEAERLAKEEKERARAERRKIPKYQEGDIVLSKDGKYYEVFMPYYHDKDETVYYSSVPTTPDGTWDIPEDEDDYRWAAMAQEIDQKDIQRRIKKAKASKISASTTYGMQIHPDDADGEYSVAIDGDWKAYNWEDSAWGRLMSYDKDTKLYTVQWADGHTSQHYSSDLMTIEKANAANQKYWEGDDNA